MIPLRSTGKSNSRLTAHHVIQLLRATLSPRDETAWRVWKIIVGGNKQRPGGLREDLCAPLDRWMATRLVRLFPIILTLYERVKARRRQLDQLDLLLKLRRLASHKPRRTRRVSSRCSITSWSMNFRIPIRFRRRLS